MMQMFIVWVMAGIEERVTARQGDEAFERGEGNGDNFGIFSLRSP
jgi:hypothetical protein